MAKRMGDSFNNARHSKKPKQGNFFCDLCNVDCNSSDMLAKHCYGKKHRALMGRGNSKNSTNSKADKGNVSVEEDQLHCEVCNVWCNSKVLLESHVNGKKHKVKEAKKRERTVKEEQEAKKDKELWCRVCDVWCNSKAVMESHASGRKHKAKQEMAALYVDDDTDDDDDEYWGVGVEGEVCDAKEEETGEKGAADLGPQGQMGGDEAEIEVKENVVECLDTQDGMCKEEEGKETEDEEEEAFIGSCNGVKESDAQGLISNGEAIMEEKENEEEGLENEEDVDAGCDGVEGSEAQGEMEAKEDVGCEHEEEEEQEEEEEEQEHEEENREKKVLWCLMCRVQCNSQAMIMKHLKGDEHKETVALRRKRSLFRMEYRSKP